MRLLILFLTVGSLHLSAASFSQTVTLTGKDLQLNEVFAAIRSQTGYGVIASKQMMRHGKVVSLRAQQQPLDQFLEEVFAGQPLTYSIVDNNIIIKERPHMTAISSEVNEAFIKQPELNLVLAYPLVSGRVTDSTGMGLAGASVRVLNADGKRTTLQAKTDEGGYFELRNVPEDALLEISYVGYMKRTTPAQVNMGNLQLKAIPSELEEVEVMVNTGYQQVPRERATGSFVFIDKEQLESRNDHRLLDRLVDFVPGLQFDNRGFTDNRNLYSFNIRGQNSFLTTINGPLVIVDDMPYEGSIDLINPADVESVTLLKDAAARSIWGARAANGVIVITMKKPQSGSPVQVTFGSNVDYSEKQDLWYRRTMSTSDFIDREIEMFKTGYYDNDLTAFNRRTRVTSPLVDLLGEHRAGDVSDDVLNAQIARWRKIDYRNEYNELIANNPVRQSYRLGFNGSSEWVNYLVSGSYETATEKLKFNYNDRYSMRAITELKPTKSLSIELGMMYIQNQVESGAGTLNYPISPGGGKGALYPYAELQGPDGEALAIPYQFNKRFVDTAGNGKLLDWTFRPLEEIGLRSYNRTFDNMNVHVRIKYDFTQHLKAEVRYGLEKQGLKTENLAHETSFEMRDLINRWTQINGDQVQYTLPLGARLRVDDESTINQQFRGQVAYNRDWDHTHAVSAFLASDIAEVKGKSAAYSAYGYDQETETHVLVDYLTAYQTFGNLYGKYRIPSYFGFDSSTKRVVSFLGNASYTFRSRYVVSGSARRDASNLLGVRTNERWKPLWSVGLAWSAHQEDFFNVSWISMLKIRSTYGHSGNIVAGNGYYPTLYMSNNAMYSGLPYAGISTPPDPDRKWEDARMINLGVDFGFWNNRLSGSLEYFNKKNTDLIAADQLDPTSSLASMSRNVGILVGNGLDVILNSSNIRSRNFSWNTNFSLSYVKDVVKKYYGTMGSAQYMITDGGKSAFPMEGYSMYSIFSYRSAGLDPENGDPRGYDRNTGEISKDYTKMLQDSIQYLTLHGPGIPPIHGFIRNTLTYKNFDLSVNLSFKFGSYFREEIYGDNSYNNWAQYGNYAGRWQKPGDEQYTYIPSSVYPVNGNRLVFASANEDFVHKSDLIRLTDLRLGYKTRINTSRKPLVLHAYLGARNLGLLWTANDIDVDPDNIYFNTPRSYSFGVNITY